MYLLLFILRFEPALRRAVQQLALECTPAYALVGGNAGDANNNNSQLRDFFVSMLSTGHYTKIRQLTAGMVGELWTITGTVTRTSVVRPELVTGGFQCQECQEVYTVEQQFVYTTVYLFLYLLYVRYTAHLYF